jgi:hypothetical protein
MKSCYKRRCGRPKRHVESVMVLPVPVLVLVLVLVLEVLAPLAVE